MRVSPQIIPQLGRIHRSQSGQSTLVRGDVVPYYGIIPVLYTFDTWTQVMIIVKTECEYNYVTVN